MANALTDPKGAIFPPTRFDSGSGTDPLPRPSEREGEVNQHDPANKDDHAEGATAGAPGSFTGGDVDPANAAQARDWVITPSPRTAWTTGQYVQGSTAGAAGEMHWTGSAWASGRKA